MMASKNLASTEKTVHVEHLIIEDNQLKDKKAVVVFVPLKNDIREWCHSVVLETQKIFYEAEKSKSILKIRFS